jgi:hypothetical protein
MQGTYPRRLKDEYERVLERHGSPIIPADFPQNLDFQSCCNRWELNHFLPTLRKWAATEQEAPRHWPVLAFAVDQYVFLSDQLNKNGILSVADVVDALTLIDEGADKLARGITRFHKMSAALGCSVEDLDRIAQIERLFDRLTTNALNVTLSDLKNPLALIGHDALIKSFSLMAERIGRAAKNEAKTLERGTLRANVKVKTGL